MFEAIFHMFATIFQFGVSGMLFILLFWLKLRHIMLLIYPIVSERCCVWLNGAVHTIIGLVAVGCLLDPLIAGAASVTIHAPTQFPTTKDNLQVRVIPLGFSGPAGGGRTVYAAFDSRGVAEVTVVMRVLETRMEIAIIDRSRPSEVVDEKSVYISPFVRSRLATKLVVF